MNYGQLKQAVVGELKNNSVRPTQIETWITSAIARAQGKLKTPASTKVVNFTVGDTFDRVIIPGDFLRLISISVNGRELRRSDPTTVREKAIFLGTPDCFFELDGTYELGPRPQKDAVIELAYSATFAPLADDADTNILLQIAPDIVVSGAMYLACRYSLDPRRDLYGEDFERGIADLNTQAAQDELTNASIGPGPYSMNFGED